MIFTERTIMVVNDSATINKPLILYRGDKNIELKITIAESQFKFRSTGASNVIETANASYAQLVINTPYGSPIFSEVTATENGTVIFVISAAMIDEIREVGIYDIQIRLLDDNKQSRVTIPPVSNAIEIREPMAIEDGSAVDSNVVNVAKVNRALTTTSAPLEAFDSQGNYIKKTWGDGDPITDAALNKMEAAIDGVNKKVANNSSQINAITNNFTLTIGSDGLLYISDGKGNLLGNGIDIGNGITINKGKIVFDANFNDTNLSNEQFTTWNGRIYDSSIYEIGTCTNNQLHLTSVYDSENSRWIKQMCHTAGLFESDNFTCEFKAKFDGKAGSWNNVITYGTGTYWTNGLYSEGVKWPAGGEIDAFEQAGGYAENPNGFNTPTVHYGAGTESGYPNTHEIIRGVDTLFTTNEWHIFKFILKNGVVEIYIDDEKKQEYDFSNCTVNNNYLCEYRPFLKPQAFYLDGSCASSSNTSNTYDFVIDYFKIYQDEKVDATSLSIFPQMWTKGTNLIFPTGAETLLAKEFTPANVSNKACTWTSSNTSVATVVQGYVKTLTEGTATITATNGNVSATYNLTVNNTSTNIPCAKILINSEDINLSEGNTTSISTCKYPKFATDTVVFSSDNPSIATIDETSGLITAIGEGTCNVTATCGSKTFTISVTVIPNNEPAIKYDMTTVTSAISERFATWSSDKTEGTIATITNIGTLGSVANSILSVASSDFMNPTLSPKTDTIAIQKTDTWLWVIKNWAPNTAHEELSLNATGLNKMPSLRYSNNKLYIRYGGVEPYNTTNIPATIVIGHDTVGYYLYIDGEIVATGGSETETGYLENIYGLKYGGFGLIMGEESKTSICNKIEAIQTAVYLNDRNSIQAILDRDFV